MSTPATPRESLDADKKSRRQMWLIVAGLAVVGLAYCGWPRQANLRGFDPAVVGRMETAMWRHYYQHEYFSLFRALYSLNRNEYHFSPADSVHISYFAVKAAAVFQRSRSRTEAQAALPMLERFYRILHDRSREKFDPHEAARLELEWWQLRREEATPAQYGEGVALVAKEVFRADNDAVKQGALLRAKMMRYRDDRRDGKMNPEDWTQIERELTRSYQLMKIGLN